MMTMPTTDLEVRLLGLQALNKELGHIGTLRFMQQFSRGEGNYVNDRHEWQQHYTVDTLVAAIKQAEKDKEEKNNYPLQNSAVQQITTVHN